MNLTTKGRYAVMAMVDLAMQNSQKPTSIADISLRQNIPTNYLEQIFMKLKDARLVKSVRGPGGGYCMVQHPAEIKISQIINAVEESIKMTRCGLERKNCRANGKCITHELWEGLSDHIYDYFNSISLEDIYKSKEQNYAVR